MWSFLIFPSLPFAASSPPPSFSISVNDNPIHLYALAKELRDILDSSHIHICFLSKSDHLLSSPPLWPPRSKVPGPVSPRLLQWSPGCSLSCWQNWVITHIHTHARTHTHTHNYMYKHQLLRTLPFWMFSQTASLHLIIITFLGKSIMIFQEKFKSIHYHLVRTFLTEINMEGMTDLFIFKCSCVLALFSLLLTLKEKNININ